MILCGPIPPLGIWNKDLSLRRGPEKSRTEAERGDMTNYSLVEQNQEQGCSSTGRKTEKRPCWEKGHGVASNHMASMCLAPVSISVICLYLVRSLNPYNHCLTDRGTDTHIWAHTPCWWLLRLVLFQSSYHGMEDFIQSNVTLILDSYSAHESLKVPDFSHEQLLKGLCNTFGAGGGVVFSSTHSFSHICVCVCVYCYNICSVYIRKYSVPFSHLHACYHFLFLTRTVASNILPFLFTSYQQWKKNQTGYQILRWWTVMSRIRVLELFV